MVGCPTRPVRRFKRGCPSTGRPVYPLPMAQATGETVAAIPRLVEEAMSADLELFSPQPGMPRPIPGI